MIGEEEFLFPYLASQLDEGDKELLLVVAVEVAKLGTWRRDLSSEYGSKLTRSLDGNTSKTTDILTTDKAATLPPRLQSVDDL